MVVVHCISKLCKDHLNNKYLQYIQSELILMQSFKNTSIIKNKVAVVFLSVCPH